MSRLYSPREAAECLLGWKGKRCGQKLLRAIVRRERQLGFRFAKRVHGRNNLEWIEIDEPTLREQLPNLFEISQVELANEIREKFKLLQESIKEQIDSQIDDRVKNGQRHASNVMSELRKTETGLAAEISRLARRIDKIERGI
jgi:hypothetical protein